MVIIFQKIKNTLEKEFSSLNLVCQEHYCLRMWRISKKEKYLKPVIKREKQVLKKWLENCQQLDNKNYQKDFALKLLNNFKIDKNERKKKQKEFYLKNPQYKFLTNFIWQTHKLKDFNLNNKYKNQFLKSLLFFNNQSVRKIYLSSDYLKADPSESVNSICFLKNLEVVDLSGELKNMLEKNYYPLNKLKEYQYYLWLYSLTHIIIAASNYYQQFVSSEKYQWILRYFKDNFETIVKKATPDIIAEIGICCKLTRSNKNLIEKTKQLVISSFDPEKGYIPRKDMQTLNDIEHRNTLAIMLFSDFDKLYKGPDLSEYF